MNLQSIKIVQAATPEGLESVVNVAIGEGFLPTSQSPIVFGGMLVWAMAKANPPPVKSSP